MTTWPDNLSIEATTAPAAFARWQDAESFLMDLLGDADLDAMSPAATIREAKRIAQLDAGGDSATFERVVLAEAKLREEGIL